MSFDSLGHETKQAKLHDMPMSQAAKRRARKRTLQEGTGASQSKSQSQSHTGISSGISTSTSASTSTSTSTSNTAMKPSKTSKHNEDEKKSSNVTVIYGDLFKAPHTDSLAHCVSVDLSMSKGIAVEFVKQFAGREELRAQKAGVGQVAMLQHDSRYIYYLITKTRYYHKPTLSSLESSLLCMKQHMIKHQVKSLAMPKIGCGLDLLSWDDVLPMIQRIFADTDISVTIYLV